MTRDPVNLGYVCKDALGNHTATLTYRGAEHSGRARTRRAAYERAYRDMIGRYGGSADLADLALPIIGSADGVDVPEILMGIATWLSDDPREQARLVDPDALLAAAKADDRWRASEAEEQNPEHVTERQQQAAARRRATRSRKARKRPANERGPLPMTGAKPRTKGLGTT